jgi:DNA-binding response OmpR family regulator
MHRGDLDKGAFMIQKPISKKELAARVREVLPGRIATKAEGGTNVWRNVLIG